MILRLMPFCRHLVVLILLFAPSGVHAIEPQPETVHAVWVADSGGILRLAPESGELLLVLPTEEPVRAVEVDLLRLRLWAVTGSTLHGYELDGTPIIEIGLSGPMPADVLLKVDPEDGSLWIGVGRELRNVSPAGQVLVERRLEQQLEGLAVDRTERRVWVATRKTVLALDATSGLTLGGHCPWS